MTKTRTQKLTQLAIITALSLVLGKTFQFTMVVGFFTLLDVGIYLTAFRFGKKEAAVVGALSGFLIDLISGYPQYMIPSLIAHGLQGYFAGFTGKKRLLGLVLATVVMVVTYYLVETWLEGNWVTPLGALSGNIFQTLVGLALGYALSRLLKQVIK
jgi:uncharacterized membrane protein